MIILEPNWKIMSHHRCNGLIYNLCNAPIIARHLIKKSDLILINVLYYSIKISKYTYFLNYFPFVIVVVRGVIGEVRCGFLQIYAPTPYSAIFLLHAPALTPIKIGFGAVRCDLVWCSVGAVLQSGLDSFGSNWANLNVNFNLKNPPLQQLKNLANYSIQI